jgi:hypothetical protein
MQWLLPVAVAHLVFATTFLVGVLFDTRKRDFRKVALSRRAQDAALARDVGALEGIAVSDGHAPIIAPFSGRRCLAYHIEVITIQTQLGSRRVDYERVYEQSCGDLLLVDDRRRAVGRVAFDRARPLVPTKLSKPVHGSTVHKTTRSIFDPRPLPARLLAFIVQHDLPWPRKDALLPGVELAFNERVVLPGDRIVAAGRCRSDKRVGVYMCPDENEELPVLFERGTLAEVRIAT